MILGLRVLVLLAVMNLGAVACSRSSDDEQPARNAGAAVIVYQAPFGLRSFLFDRDANRMEVHLGGVHDQFEGGEANVPFVDCSDEQAICRQLPGGPIFISVHRQIETVDRWSVADSSFTVRRRSGAESGNQRIFVEATSNSDPTWKEGYVYEIGRGVTAITVNYDHNSRLSETLLLVGHEGILSDLNE